MADSAEHASAVVQSLAAGLYRNTDGSLVDFRIKCGEREWKVHKIVLSINSTVLGAECTKDFKEANQGYIELSEDGEMSVEALVSYLHSFKYDPGLASDDPCFHVKMCIIADKYDISPLKREAFCKTLRFVYDNAEATKEIRKHLTNLFIKDNIMDHVVENEQSTFELAMRDYADLATDVAVALQVRARSKAAKARRDGSW